MSKRGHWKLKIEDMIARIEKIERYCAGKTYDEFAGDEILVDALERNFAVIGEASNLVPPYIKLAYPDVPWRALYGMRNHIVHGYDLPETRIMWTTAKNRLAELKTSLKNIRKYKRKGH